VKPTMPPPPRSISATTSEPCHSGGRSCAHPEPRGVPRAAPRRADLERRVVADPSVGHG
jgi:hypothetical protein